MTSNYSLNRPLVNNATDQDLWGGYLNDNADTIDTKLKLGIDRVKRVITTTDSVVASDRKKHLLCDATLGAFTETLLACATAGDGFEVTITKTDASAFAVLVDGAGADTVGGAANFSLTGQGDSITIVSDGVSNWNFTGNKTTPSAVPSASTTAQGIIEIATTAEVHAGASAVLAVTPASMLAGIGFTEYYESAEIAFSNGSAISPLTHALGAVPKNMIAELVCKTIDGGYAVGDRLLALSAIGQGTTFGLAVSYNTTQINAIAASSGIQMINKSTGAGFTLTAASWRLVLRAWG